MGTLFNHIVLFFDLKMFDGFAPSRYPMASFSGPYALEAWLTAPCILHGKERSVGSVWKVLEGSDQYSLYPFHRLL